MLMMRGEALWEWLRDIKSAKAFFAMAVCIHSPEATGWEESNA